MWNPYSKFEMNTGSIFSWVHNKNRKHREQTWNRTRAGNLLYKADTKIMDSGINSVSHLPYILQVSTHLTNHLPSPKRTSWYS